VPLAFLLAMSVYALLVQLGQFYAQKNWLLLGMDIIILLAALWVTLEAFDRNEPRLQGRGAGATAAAERAMGDNRREAWRRDRRRGCGSSISRRTAAPSHVAQRDEEDLFMLLVFAETLGVPNPASWYTAGTDAGPVRAIS
jgi:hypothetical protein